MRIAGYVTAKKGKTGKKGHKKDKHFFKAM